MTMTTPLIQTTRAGRVVIATLNNPPHALMTMRMVEELAALVRSVENDPEVGAVILTGAHPERFLAHFDVAEILASARHAPPTPLAAAAFSIRLVDLLRRLPGMERWLMKTPLAGVLIGRRFHDTLLSIGRSQVVYIAAINGYALGGGCELAMACDFRLMVNAAVGIGQPEIALGFPPGAGGTQRLTRLIGRGQALQLCLEGIPVMPNEALRLGLIHQVVAPQRLMHEALRLAQRMARRSKPAVAAVKRAVLEGGSLPLEAGLRVEQAGFLHTLTTPAAKRAMKAYLAKQQELGAVPGYDPVVQVQLLDGEFVNMTGR